MQDQGFLVRPLFLACSVSHMAFPPCAEGESKKGVSHVSSFYKVTNPFGVRHHFYDVI